MAINYGKGPDELPDEVTTEVEKDFPHMGLGVRFAVRSSKGSPNVWFIYDCAKERVVDVVMGACAEETVRMRTSALNKQVDEQRKQ